MTSLVESKVVTGGTKNLQTPGFGHPKTRFLGWNKTKNLRFSWFCGANPTNGFSFLWIQGIPLSNKKTTQPVTRLWPCSCIRLSKTRWGWSEQLEVHGGRGRGLQRKFSSYFFCSLFLFFLQFLILGYAFGIFWCYVDTCFFCFAVSGDSFGGTLYGFSFFSWGLSALWVSGDLSFSFSFRSDDWCSHC